MNSDTAAFRTIDHGPAMRRATVECTPDVIDGDVVGFTAPGTDVTTTHERDAALRRMTDMSEQMLTTGTRADVETAMPVSRGFAFACACSRHRSWKTAS